MRSLPSPLQQLLQISATLAVEDAKTLEWWAPEEAPAVSRWSALGWAFACHLSEMPASETALIASVIERAMTSDSTDLQALAAAGFLESAVAAASNKGNQTDVLRVLGSESQDYYRYWAGL